VGALAHYLEKEGIPTTQISLIREHTEAIQPPRALWVPFELGRPLGVSGDRSFQHRVLLAALHLLEAEKGPVLVDFPEDAYDSRNESNQAPQLWACPVNFGGRPDEASTSENLIASLADEVRQLRPWYDLRMGKLDRTAMVHFSPDSVVQFLGELSRGNPPADSPADLPLAVAIRIAAQDIKAFYFEAATAKPGAAVPSSEEFSEWFWQNTAAGRVLSAVKNWCLDQDDKTLQMAGAMLLVPLGR
jgi:hypothetical protein